MKHDFVAKYAYSDTAAIAERTRDIATRDLLAVSVTRAEREDDLRGVDFWARLVDGRRVSIDVKLRGYDHGDVFLEVVSRTEEGKVGWALNERYITDFVLFLWKTRYLLVSYPQLRAALKNRLAGYVKRYGTSQATSKGRDGVTWHTDNVGIPTARFLADMYGSVTWPFGTPLTAPKECAHCHHMHPAGVTCLACPECQDVAA